MKMDILCTQIEEIISRTKGASLLWSFPLLTGMGSFLGKQWTVWMELVLKCKTVCADEKMSGHEAN